MDAAGDQRTTRARAIDGLRAIAQLEEYVAAEIAEDVGGYFGELAGFLRQSSCDRRDLAAELESPRDPPPASPPRLRLV
jgi:hypothetical protein